MAAVSRTRCIRNAIESIRCRVDPAVGPRWRQLGTGTNEQDQQLNRIGNIARSIVIGIQGIGTGAIGTATEHELQYVDRIGNIDRTICIGIATNKLGLFTDIWNPVAVAVGFRSCIDVALVENAIAVAVGAVPSGDGGGRSHQR